MDEKAKKEALRRAKARLRRAEIKSEAFRRIREVKAMPAATTATLAGYTVAVSLGVVVAEVVRVGDLVSNLAVNLRDGWGGRSGALEDLLSTARRECLEELRRRADKIGANAIVGVRLDVELPTKALLVVVGSATAVIVESTHPDVSDGDADEYGQIGGDVAAEFGTCVTCGGALVLVNATASEVACPACELPTLPELPDDDVELPGAPT